VEKKKRGEEMIRILPVLAVLPVIIGCQPRVTNIYLHTYDGDTMAYPDDFPNDKPSIIAFLDLDDRRNDGVVKNLRGYSARPEVGLVGVFTYSDNSFVDNVTTQKDLVFPIMLDPKRKMSEHFGVKRYPTFILINTEGREKERTYDVNKLREWYSRRKIDESSGRRHKPTPEDQVIEE
jgi:hypothetical protein